MKTLEALDEGMSGCRLASTRPSDGYISMSLDVDYLCHPFLSLRLFMPMRFLGSEGSSVTLSQQKVASPATRCKIHASLTSHTRYLTTSTSRDNRQKQRLHRGHKVAIKLKGNTIPWQSSSSRNSDSSTLEVALASQATFSLISRGKGQPARNGTLPCSKQADGQLKLFFRGNGCKVRPCPRAAPVRS